MMQSIRQWTAGVCCAAIACTLLEMLHPSGAMKKAARYVTALFFLAAMLIPLAQMDGALPSMEPNAASSAEEETQSLTELMERQTISAAEESIRQQAVRELVDIHVTPVSVSPVVEADAQRNYCLTRLIIRLQPEDVVYESTIRMRMQKLLQITPELIYDTESKGGGSNGTTG